MQPERSNFRQPDAHASPQLTPELADFSGRLAALAPSPARLDRDRLMYEAGRMATPAARRPPAALLWQLSTAALALVSLGLAGALVNERGAGKPIARNEPPPTVSEVAGVNRQPARTISPSPSSDTNRASTIATASPTARLVDDSYFMLRARVLAQGPDALPAIPFGSVGDPAPLRVRDGLRRLIGG